MHRGSTRSASDKSNWELLVLSRRSYALTKKIPPTTEINLALFNLMEASVTPKKRGE